MEALNEDVSDKSATCRKHVDFAEIQLYLTSRQYPSHVITKGDKANFRRSVRRFAVVDNQLVYCKKQKDDTIKQVCAAY